MMMLKSGALFADRYEIVRVLSSGGMGVVYEVLHRDTQRRRAMKIMLPALLADDDMRSRFAREAIVTADIESEHLVEVFDAGVDKDTGAPFLVMELLRGEDLGARLTREERTGPRDLLEICDQLTRALTKTHEAGIVHRDLKPENIFVTRREDGTLRMKILDFGIAKLIDRGAKSTRSVGTPIYMAPEQMTGKGIGPASDLYALAQIAFTLLVGAPYFDKEAERAENVLGLMYAVGLGTKEPATLRARELGVELPPAFDAWFAKATHLDVASRFASVKQQTDALHDVLDGAPATLPRSSGAARRAAAFGATEALGADASAPLADAGARIAPARVERSGAPARTHVSSQSDAPPAASTTAGPSSRTLTGDTRARGPSRATGIAIAFAVTAAAAVAIGLALSKGDTPDPGAALGTATEARPSVATPTSLAKVPSATLEPQVAPAPDASSPTSSRAADAAGAGTQPSASASPSASSPPAKSPKSAPGKGRPTGSAATPPATSAPSTPPPPAGTVWSGPRR